MRIQCVAYQSRRENEEWSHEDANRLHEYR